MREPVTQSELSTFSRCEERHNLRYNKLLVPFQEHPALKMGSAFHAGIEYQSVDAALERLRGPDPMWSLFEGPAAVVREATVSAMVAGALARWDVWPEVHELGFSLPLINPATGRMSRRHSLQGVIDGVWQFTHPDYGGDVVLGEWKTAAQVSDEYMQRLEIDFQVSTYLWAASRHYGRPVRRVIYRVVKKPTIRQKKTEELDDYVDRLKRDYMERPEHYYFETVVERTDEQLSNWAEQAWATHQRILQIRNGAIAIRSTQSCLNRGRCPYFDLCVGAVTKDAFKVLDRRHTELKENNNELNT
jgi:hypothetical protein